MAKINWTVSKETFQPDKNYFTVKPVEVSREESDFEIENNKLGDLADTAGMLLMVLFSVFVVLSGICLVGVLANEPKYSLICLSIFIPSLLCAVFIPKLCFKASDKYYALAYKYCEENDVWNTPEVQAIREYNIAQVKLASAWREAHPFEEHIRACFLDTNSSVAIADAARYYAEHFLNKE
jgi:hypothetical protein